MNRTLYLSLHIGIWAFMFLSPLTFMRGNSMPAFQYAMNCMTPLLMMVVFYVNYFWLTPRNFVVGKRRYFLLFNLIMVVGLGIFLHLWVLFTRDTPTDNLWQFCISCLLFIAAFVGVKFVKVNPIRMIIYCAIAGLILLY